MNVQSIIQLLEKMNPLTEVVMDFSKEGDNFFTLAPIEKIEEVENELGEPLILLSPFLLHGTTEESQN